MIPIRRVLALAVGIPCLLALPAGALGATITVTTTADTMDGDGICSLREAIVKANTNVSIDNECPSGPPGADTIALGPGTYRLTRAMRGENLAASGDLDIIGPLEIVGAGAALTTIDATGVDRAIEVRPGAVVGIRNLTITGGVADAGASGPSTVTPTIGAFGGNGTTGACGGGIFTGSATVTLSGVRVTGNAAGQGGAGVAATGPTGKIGSGGNGGAGGAGGGICQAGGTLTVAESTIAGNRSGAGGAAGEGVGGQGLAAAGGVGAGGRGGSGFGGPGGDGGAGGGIAVIDAGTLSVIDSTVVDNRTGPGGAAGRGTGSSGGGGTPPGADGDSIGGRGGAGGAGGGIAGDGQLTVTRGLIAGNATGAGGQGGRAFANNATADGGDGGAGGNGGGIAQVGNGSLALVNVTISGDATGGGGGAGGHGIALAATSGDGGLGGRGGGVASDKNLVAQHITLSANGAGAAGSSAFEGGVGGTPGTPGSGGSAGVWSTGTSSLTRSILSGNACDTVNVPIVDDTLNIAFQSSGCTGAALDPRLGPLAENGGPTRTSRPGAGSPAIDRVPRAAGCTATDQRGALRPVGAGCDVGAVEVAPPAATTGGAGAITGTTASLAGTVETHGLGAGYIVEFGTTTAYGRQVAGTVGGAPSPSAVTAAAMGLTPGTTYHYRVVASGPDGTSAGADRTLTTTGARVAGGPGSPRVSGLSISPRVFAVVPRGAKLRARTRTRTALGATIRFRLSEAARVSIVVQRTVRGRRAKVARGRTRCVAAPARARVVRRARCVLHPGVGTLLRSGSAGVNLVVFRGRIGTKALRAGAYRLAVTATDASGARSLTAQVPFTVLSGVTAPRRG